MSDIKTLADLRPDNRNANRGTPRGRGMVETSLQKYGAGRSVLVDRNGKLIAGNKTSEAAAAIGLDEVVVVQTNGQQLVVVQRTDLDLDTDTAARELAIADNRAGELGLEWDADVLTELSESIDLSTFWTKDEIAAVLEQDTLTSGGGDDAPEVQDGPTRVQSGELWQLGRHRLLCGDSTRAEDVARLMQGERAAICFTSPPYNIADNGKLSFHPENRVRKYIDKQGDNLSESGYLAFLSAFTDAAMIVSDYVIVNLQQLAGNKVAFIEYQYLYREHFADVMIWHKQRSQPAMASGVMNSDFEFIVFLSAGKDATRAIKTGHFRGTVSNVYVAPPQQDNEFADVHGATFPLHLPTMITETFSSRDDIVIDPFSGTGTTLIACERTGRRCYGIEIEPRYCDVILKRFTAETGIEPERIDG